uniref:TYW2 N-terminal domain-containing protein n=1 Tax=Sinocyclocheilus rhinocerous TaxID=307959 RepID=A0A673GJA8_9TELE
TTKYLQSQGVLDRKDCAQKHSDGTVTLPVVASVLAQLDLVELMKHVAQNSFLNLGLIPSSEEGWPVACRLKWKTNIKHIEHVKTYIPHISHVVLDLECKPF